MYRKYRDKIIRPAALLLACAMFINAAWTGVSNTAYAGGNPTDQAAQQGGYYRIVALGDSITAGYESGFSEHSTPYGYVEHLFEQSLFLGNRTAYTNYGLLGLRTTGLHALVQAAAEGRLANPDDIQKKLPDPRAKDIVSQTKELNTSLKQADLIVMTIGGNDLFDVMIKLQQKSPIDEANALLEDLLNTYEKELEAALRIIVKLNPDATIAVADQYLPVPAPLKVGSFTIPLFPEVQRQFLLTGLGQLHDRLNGIVYRLNSEGAHALAVNISAPFLGSETKLTSIADGDVHPNRQGYTAIGRAFSKAVWGSYRTVRPRAANVPISIVASGKELPANASKPIIRDGRTFVAMRDITDALGAKLSWSSSAQTASIEYNGHRVSFAIGSKYVVIDGKRTELKSPPAFLSAEKGSPGKTYLPLAALSDSLGLQVVYRNQLQTVFINK
ncbi:stalk domain-containing protein [Paenibacillus gorillae]|uniref:stalk domain-containing protein n=1 Tax=Paenibacillus gorillae TaxID=1243662 RepID=UPI0012DCDDAF|nr:stalk domain-containing protein [Paenibacillus gorillae]